MLGRLGPTELIIILVIVILIFGASRLADVGGALGKGIKEFRKSVKEEEGEEDPLLPPPDRPPEEPRSSTADRSDPSYVKGPGPQH
ncbi:MAG: twin-arginine translocase TatA/TatE family subunit [Dehalococcoidia bacterium]|nr:twin-arginine translocase TatA/TatE family subunit [Dehalococcoidia bacterium]